MFSRLRKKSKLAVNFTTKKKIKKIPFGTFFGIRERRRRKNLAYGGSLNLLMCEDSSTDTKNIARLQKAASHQIVWLSSRSYQNTWPNLSLLPIKGLITILVISLFKCCYNLSFVQIWVGLQGTHNTENPWIFLDWKHI